MKSEICSMLPTLFNSIINEYAYELFNDESSGQYLDPLYSRYIDGPYLN